MRSRATAYWEMAFCTFRCSKGDVSGKTHSGKKQFSNGQPETCACPQQAGKEEAQEDSHVPLLIRVFRISHQCWKTTQLLRLYSPKTTHWYVLISVFGPSCKDCYTAIEGLAFNTGRASPKRIFLEIYVIVGDHLEVRMTGLVEILLQRFHSSP